MKKLKLLLLGLLLCTAGKPYAQGLITVSGIVSDFERKEPLVGASVVAGSGVGVSTLADGTYSIAVPAGTRLVYQFVGYEPVEFVCPQANAQHNVQLKSDAQVLQDVVVVAYGVRKKGTITGSVSVVKSDKLADVPAASFDQALQGQTPGLTVLSNSGEPGAAATFHIRGANSINSGTAPLFILDGIAIASADFNAISPSDIESVTVLKDAASTSIYGARAANGVVVITTRRGRMAKNAQVTFRTQLGFSQLAHGNWNMMNTSERIQYEKEVGLDTGKDYDKLSKINVNWLDEVFRKNALLQNYELQVSGASERVNYFISGSFFDQEGVALDSNFRRYTLRSNLDVKANSWLRMGTNTMLTYEQTTESNSGEYATNSPIAATRFMMPYWDPYRKDGSLASINDGSWKGQGQNPLEWAEMNPYENKKYKVISTIFAEVKPIDNLTIRSTFGLDYTHGAASVSSAPSYLPNNHIGNAGRNSTDMMGLTSTNTINYRFDLPAGHNLNLMVAQEGITYQSEGFSITTAGQNNDRLTNLAAGTVARSWSSAESAYSYLSFFGRGEYNFDNRYFVEAAVRTDGSSRFGRNGRWAGFWSVGLMWNLRNEKALRDVEWLTNLQLSASTGTSGNSSIPNYEHMALVGGGLEYVGTAAIAPMSKESPDLGWEKLWSTNVGIKAGFWNRLNVEVDLYNKKTSDMLMLIPVSYSDAGYGARWDNVGGMINRGIEFNINADVIPFYGSIGNSC